MDDNRPDRTYSSGIDSGAWISWLIVIAGIWQIFAPWIWGYSWHSAAVWSDVVAGIVITVGALGAATSRTEWPGWWNILLGVWLVISPFVLGYTFIPRAQANDIVVGSILIVLGLISAVRSPVIYGGSRTERNN